MNHTKAIALKDESLFRTVVIFQNTVDHLDQWIDNLGMYKISMNTIQTNFITL